MESKRQLTREELLEMESAPKTKMQHMLDVVICFCPYFAAIIMFLVYYLMPDAVQNFNPHVFTIVVCFFLSLLWNYTVSFRSAPACRIRSSFLRNTRF